MDLAGTEWKTREVIVKKPTMTSGLTLLSTNTTVVLTVTNTDSGNPSAAELTFTGLLKATSFDDGTDTRPTFAIPPGGSRNVTLVRDPTGIAPGDPTQTETITVKLADGTTDQQTVTVQALPAATNHIFISTDFNTDTGSTNHAAYFPSGWAKGDGSWKVYGSTSDDNVGTLKGWLSGYNIPGSSGTGPAGGMDKIIPAADGANDPASTYRYLYVETSSPGSPSKRLLLRTPLVDLSTALSNSTLKMTFWFHAYGATIGQLGVAATTSAASSISADEVVSGSGFTADTTGGLSMTFWDQDGGSTSTTSERIDSGVFTYPFAARSDNYRKVEIDLDALAGESTVYFYFFYMTGTSYTGDFGIDNVSITGQI
jgi:hypothetical protein